MIELQQPSLRNIFFDKVKSRIEKRNQNWISVFIGQTGSGKTYGALQCAYELSVNGFKPTKHIIFTVEEFLKKLHTFNKGDYTVFEEVGVNVNSKNWQSDENKSINFIIQTCRYKNFGLILTVPSMKFFDKSSRDLIHNIFLADHIDYKNNISYFRVYNYKFDAVNGTDPYRVRPLISVGKHKIRLGKIQFKKPNDDILKYYEKQKDDFANKLYKELEEKINNKKLKEKVKIEKMKAKKCSVCGGGAWIPRKRDNSWECRKCGYKITRNPYVKNDNN